MLRKQGKQTELQTYYPTNDLEGGIFMFGRIGAGKSASGKSIVEGYHDNKHYKIFDVWGGERDEHLFWGLPSQDDEYWNRFKVFGKFDENPQKQYKVKFLYPYFETKMLKQLPKKGHDVISQVFTIPLQDITVTDLGMVMNNLSETAKSEWETLIENTKKTYNSGTLQYLCDKLSISKKSSLHKHFIHHMIREKFLADKFSDYNLDLKKEAKDRDTVTVLCLDLVPKKFQLFVLNYFLRKLTELLDDSKIPKKNIYYVREAANFFKATDDVIIEERFKRFRAQLTEYVRMGRRGMYPVLDCQSYSEVKGIVQSGEDYMLMFKTTSPTDKEMMCSELKREGRMRQDQINDLAFLEKGQCYIAETGEKVVKKVQIILPRSAYWRKEYGDFYKTVWEKYGGEWKNVEDAKDYVNSNLKVLKFEKDTKESKKKQKQEEKETFVDPELDKSKDLKKEESIEIEVPKRKLMRPLP